MQSVYWLHNQTKQPHRLLNFQLPAVVVSQPVDYYTALGGHPPHYQDNPLYTFGRKNWMDVDHLLNIPAESNKIE